MLTNYLLNDKKKLLLTYFFIKKYQTFINTYIYEDDGIL